jgi:hypothetical protein
LAFRQVSSGHSRSGQQQNGRARWRFPVKWQSDKL